MGLFKNKVGSGVEKNRGKQNSFKRYWELFFNKFWTFFKLNLVYFLFCLPIVTFGPATAALTAMMRNIYLERPQFIFSDFKDYFKENFKKSFLIGIIDVIAIELAVFVFIFWNAIIGEGYTAIQLVIIAADVLFLLINFYIYPQIAALELPMSAIIKNSFILVFVNLGGELIALALYVGYAALLRFYPIFVAPLMPFVPLAILAFTAVFCCYPAIQRVLINPYYERTGEKNPELLYTDEDAIFKDMGGKEEPMTLENPKRGGNGNSKHTSRKTIK